MGLKIGDVLEFDIESVPITAKVVNLRQVQWTSFQPNFFIQFQEGVLEEAPKTFLATIPGIQKEKLLPLQKSIVQKLPNISIIDVSRLVQKIREVITQMGLALRFMTGLTLFSGLLVLYSIANHQARSRRKEYALLKALGSPFEIIRRQNIWQYTLICLGASLLGVLFSLAISYAFSVLLLEGTWAYDPTVPVISIVLLLLLAIVITDLATRSALKEKTQQLFAD